MLPPTRSTGQTEIIRYGPHDKGLERRLVHCADQEEHCSNRAQDYWFIGNDKLKIKAAATKQKTWHDFAGRCEAETTAGDVRDLLEDNDITVVDWKELKKTQKWQERLAVFHIIIDHKDSLFEEDIWPAGVEIRD